MGDKRGNQFCEECNAPCFDEFKKVVGLRNSRLLVFLHRQKLAEKYAANFRGEETFILHNDGEKDLKREDYIKEMCQYRTKCFQCKTVVKRVRSLLDEIADIKQNEVLGVCQHCKRANPSGKCRRCEYIVNKFLCNKVQHYKERQSRFYTWVSKVNQLLHSILNIENVCKNKLFKDTSALELENLLQELRAPLEMRQLDITIFPSETGSLRSMTESKEMLEELLIKLKCESKKISSDDSLFLPPSMDATSCVCKYFMNKKMEKARQSIEIPPMFEASESAIIQEPKINVSRALNEENGNAEGTDNRDQKVKTTPSEEKTKSKLAKVKSPGKENLSPEKEAKVKSSKNEKNKDQEEKHKAEKTPKGGKEPKSKLSPEDIMLLKMMKNKEKQKTKKEKASKPEKAKQFAKIESLPKLKVREEIIEIVEEKSESVIMCDNDVQLQNKMIKGNKIVRFDPHYKDVTKSEKIPLLFNVNQVIPEPETPTLGGTITTTSISVQEKTNKQKKSIDKEKSTKGIVKYELSNREFIEKGWTILPTLKVMRRMNVYKMEPACPKYDWFKRHSSQKMLFYDTSEKLAEIDEYGGGNWFYKNGRVALHYNNKGLDTGLRYVVYSSGEEMENGKTHPVTVLASFDFQGNGVVYDHYGKIRLKYNQSEGLVVDERIAPPSRWKWHSLNDPPVLQHMFVDIHERSDPSMDEILRNQKDDRTETATFKRENPEILAIEFENFVREKADKIMQKFKPFQIRMKVVKLNKQFSLRILDQSNIYLLFRDGHVSMKLNLGMVLINSEIVDTESSDVNDVVTPYDRLPAKTPSIAEIQHILHESKRIGKSRGGNLKSTVSRNPI